MIASGSVNSVTGAVAADAIGICLPHEHLLFDLSVWQVAPQDQQGIDLQSTPVTMSSYSAIFDDPLIPIDNLVMLDENVAVDELSTYKRFGGVTLVDVTPPELGRDPEALRRISEATGVNVVMGTGHYLASTMSSATRHLSVDELTQEMVDEIEIGVSDTGVRAGVIGEIGVSEPADAAEMRMLLAAAQAHQSTGAPISVHCPIPMVYPAARILETLESGGADLTRVALCHASHTIADLDFHRRLLDSGVYLSFDRFGAEFRYRSWNAYVEPRDHEVVQHVSRLVDLGYREQILLSHDTCYRLQLEKFGGCGYAHVPVRVIRYLEALGCDSTTVRMLISDNPGRWLTGNSY